MATGDGDPFAPTMAPAVAGVDLSPVESMATVAAGGSPGPGDGRSRLPEVPLGHFRAERELARGGMGKIVAADDIRLGRPVALKVLLEPTGDAIGRFEREALITARLQHPGIVPVYEAGRWPGGEPFFAMKLVQGRPLDKVIAEATTLEARLALLPRVAAATDAIAYAHSQRIIHRDLKPANVLIGDFGETVVIDWGLAKSLDDAETSADRHPTRSLRPSAVMTSQPGATPNSNASTLTVAGAVMGTPAYMAPEQARGEPLDQRADVFALGAMLYHLLAGAPPYNARTATDVIAAAALGKVVPLTDRERRTPADLVAIVGRAMSPLPVDRYATAGELADELRRFMTGQLVGAHRYTAAQRVTRFVRKHRAAVTIAAVAVVGFSVGGVMAVDRIVTARDEAERALVETDVRGRASEELIDQMFHDVEQQLRSIGRLDLLSKLGTEVKTYFDTIEKIPGVGHGGLEDAMRMAKAIDLIGQAELKKGEPDVALRTWSQGRARLSQRVGTDVTPGTLAHRRLLAKLDTEVGQVYQQRGKAAEAGKMFARAKHQYDVLRARDPNDRETLLGGAETHDRLGDLLRNDGKIDQAYEEYSAAKADREHAGSLANGNPTEEIDVLSKSHVKLGTVYQARGDSAHAMIEYKDALRLRNTLLEKQPGNVENEQEMLDLQITLADLQRQLGDDSGAIESFKTALPLTLSLLQNDPTNTQWRRQQGLIHAGLGFALLDAGDFRAGLAALDRAIEVQRELSARDVQSTTWQVDLSRSYTRAGDGHMYLGELDAGVASYTAALDIRKSLTAKDGSSVPFRRSLAWSYAKLANAFAERGDAPHAVEAHAQALALRTQLADDSPAQSGFKNELASTEIEYGRVLLKADSKRAGELIAAGIARAHTLVDADPINNDWKETLTQGLTAKAEAARLAGDRPARRAALVEGLAVAEAATARAAQNAHWPGFVAELHVGLAEAAPDPAVAALEWKRARDALEPLAAAGRLPAARKALLARARAQR